MPAIELPEGVSFVKAEGNIQEYRLEANGLTILLSEDHSSPVAAVMVSYRAGSRDEVPGATGSAHILEHMMFKGTEKYHRRHGTQIAKMIERTGAVINANTSYDSTNYYELVPSDSIVLALDIEASRMRGTLLEAADFDSERTVVLNELERYFDSPVVELMTAVWKEAFTAHPYGHPVIGWREDVKKMPVDALRKFYDTHYWPSNAVLTIVGDFKTSDILNQVVRAFSSVGNSGATVPEKIAAEPPQESPRQVTVERAQGAEFVLVANRIPGAMHADAHALDVLAVILSRGKTSRLHQALVDKGLAAQVEAGGSGTKDPGLFTTMATLSPGIGHEVVIEAILGVYGEIAERGVTDEELERAKNQVRADAAYATDGAMSVATELSYAIGLGDWTYYTRYVDGIVKVSGEDVKRAARSYLNEQTRTVGRLQTQKKSETAQALAAAPPPPHERAPETEEPAGTPAVGEEAAAADKASGKREEHAAQNRYYENAVRSFSEKGVKLSALRTGVKDMAALSGLMAGGGTAYHEDQMVPRLAMMMLDQGTRNRGKLEIAGMLENRGAQISFGLDHEYLRFQVKCLRKDLEVVIRLLAEQLLEPAFAQKEFETVKQQERVRLQYMMSSTSARGLNAFLRGVFTPDHALYPETFEEQLAALDRIGIDDVKSFHEKNYGKGSILFSAAGDLDPEELWNFISRSLSVPDRKEGSLEPPFTRAVAGGFEGGRKYVSVEGRGNMDVLMGHPAPLTRNDPDFIPAYVANYVLGGDFTSRLSSTVRDEYGLTYGIRSGFIGVSDKTQGAWVVHMIVTPANLDAGIMRTLEQLDAFRGKGIPAEELEAKKRTVTGRYKIGLATSRELADELLNAEQWGFGPVYLDLFPAWIEGVTADQVNQAVRRYYSPDKLQVLAAGHLPAESGFLAAAPKALKKKNP